MDAATLRCPHCGAAADPAKPRCGYCRARLATVSCPSCFALMFTESTYCAACGARHTREEAPSDAACPACRKRMTSVTVGDIRLLECASCDGTWLDAEAFERICAEKEAQAAVVHHKAAATSGPERRVQYRPCVRCGTMMNRVNFARLSGTVIDVCKGHGTFMDRGELQAVVAFIHGGGLDRARQRQLDDLKEQERLLRDQETRLRATRYSTPPERSTLDFAALIDLFTA